MLSTIGLIYNELKTTNAVNTSAKEDRRQSHLLNKLLSSKIQLSTNGKEVMNYSDANERDVRAPLGRSFEVHCTPPMAKYS